MLLQILYDVYDNVQYEAPRVVSVRNTMSPFIATLMMMSHTKNYLSETNVIFHARQKHMLKINENRTMFILWPVPQ